MFFEKPVTRRTSDADRQLIVFPRQSKTISPAQVIFFRIRDTTLAGVRTLLCYFDKTNWFLYTEPVSMSVRARCFFADSHSRNIRAGIVSHDVWICHRPVYTSYGVWTYTEQAHTIHTFVHVHCTCSFFHDIEKARVNNNNPRGATMNASHWLIVHVLRYTYNLIRYFNKTLKITKNADI